jgi:molecular chaperone DnaK (HSP70)
MATDINIQSLFPALRDTRIAKPAIDVFNTTFIGIDFGTSTTVVSVATIDKTTKEITTTPIWLNQKLYDGAIMSSEKIPTVIAWYNQQLLVGKGAADLKYQLKKGVNVWYSFKMELGEDLGAKYYNSELDRNSEFPILNPKDAAKVFFQYLKAQIDRYVKTNNLPPNIQYAVSIPASFEANQRKELIYALEQNGISINKQSLIDEPNAAFLSYVQVSSAENNPLTIPDGDNPKLLVFDFGAGTCDVSILELGKNLNGIYSKNLSISKFEKLGGDDIDRLIAIEYLFPQLLKESGRKEEDFRTPQKQRIISQLLKAAEQLKIMICENIALQTNNRILPTTAISKDYVSVGYRIEIDSRKGLLTLTEPKLSYAEFNEVMKAFLKSTTIVPYKTKIVQDEFVSILNPIQTALKKASLTKNEIDYVLLIGGSSKNPYIQAALKEYFQESELLVPRDLQTHVSAGAAIHSLVFNGFGKNIIQPITSEPFLVITKDETPRVILKAGTPIPCDLIIIDDLVTSQDGQQAIELPICLGNVNKILYNIKIVSGDPHGFKKNTPVKLELEITTDKLLLARATAVGQQVMVKPINPFANKELTTEQRIVLKAERQANLEAEQNGGIPTKQGLETLYKAYKKVGNHLRAAETLELLNELYPSIYNFNEIGVLYSNAGYDEKALEYYEKAYNSNKNATTAFNYAYKLKDKDKSKFKEILEESLRLDPDKPHSLYELGRLLKRENNPEGKKMIEKAFEIWKQKFETNQMSESDYSWLSSAAEEMGMKEFAQQVRDSEPQFSGEKLYNSENLTVTSREEGLIKQ